MAGIQNFVEYEDDFIGPSVAFATSANIGSAWQMALTAGATHVRATSNAVLTLAVANEAQVASLHHGDSLAFDIDEIQSFEARLRLSAATFTTGSILTFGVGSARAAVAADVVAQANFRMAGAESTTLVYAETDDGTRDVNLVSTGTTLGTTFKRFLIDFTGGKSNVKFYIDGVRVAAATRFDMSAYSAGLQPIIQLQKGVSTNVDVCTIDYVKIVCKR